MPSNTPSSLFHSQNRQSEGKSLKLPPIPPSFLPIVWSHLSSIPCGPIPSLIWGPSVTQGSPLASDVPLRESRKAPMTPRPHSGLSPAPGRSLGRQAMKCQGVPAPDVPSPVINTSPCFTGPFPAAPKQVDSSPSLKNTKQDHQTEPDQTRPLGPPGPRPFAPFSTHQTPIPPLPPALQTSVQLGSPTTTHTKLRSSG